MNTSPREEPTSPVAKRQPRQSAGQARRIERRVIARRLIGGVVAIAIISLAFAGLALWNLRQSTITTAVTDLDTLDLLLAEQTERSFENVDLIVSSIVEDIRTNGIADSEMLRRLKGDETTRQLLREKLSGVPQLAGLSLISAEGDVINRTRTDPPNRINVADRDYFIALRDHPDVERFISKPVKNRRNGTWTVFYARRLSAKDGSFIGVVLGAMRLDYFEQFFRDVAPTAAKGINLWRDDGTLLLRYPFEEATIGRTFDLHEGFHELAARGGSALFWTQGRFTSGILAVAERKLRNFPIIVAVGVNEHTILAPWYPQAIVLGGGVGFLLIILSLAAWFFFRQITAHELVIEARTKADREAEARQELQRAVDRAEQAVRDLRQSETRFRDIAEVSGDWIWETDAQHRMKSVFGDPAFRETMNGMAPTRAIGHTRWEVAGVDLDRDPHWAAHKADLDAHRPFRNFRFMVKSLAGQELHFRISGKPVFDEAGNFVGYHGTSSNETGLVDALRRAEHAETLLREAIGNVSEGFAIYDRDDRLVLCNEAYKEIYRESAEFIIPGATFEEILRGGLAKGQYPSAIGHEEEWLEERLRDHRILRETPVEQMLPDGRWALVSDRRLSHGGRAGLRIDITALKKVQQSLHESQERLARAQRVASTGSIERDLRSTRIEWSDETFRIFGLSRDTHAPTSQALIERVHPEDRPFISKVLSLPPEAHINKKLRYRIVRPDGEVRTIYAESDILPDKDGRPARLVAVIKDITESEEAAHRQAQLEARLRHSEKLTALGTLAGGIAHDLNNMLVPIQALTKLVMRELPPESLARADLQTVIQASMQARDLVRQILAFSRKQEIVQRPVDVADATRDALQMLRASIPSTIELVENFHPVPPMMADAGQLHQVVINLVSNAAHAIGNQIGKIVVSVGRAEPRADDHAVVIALTVADTGCGMDQATAQRIFEPFYTTKPVGEGTGLGLSVVHGIVAGHGGSIEVHSEPGKGAEFVIRLPSCEPLSTIRVDAEAIA